MDFFTAVQKRYSHRLGYQKRPIARPLLNLIATSAVLAPTGKNCQTTQFMVIDDPEKVDAITEIMGKDFLLHCPAYIVCIIDKKPVDTFFGHHFQLEDCAAATENILLAATASGLASLWIDGLLRVEGRSEAIGELLKVPAEKKIEVLLPIGYAEKEGKQPQKMEFKDRIFFNEYGEE